MQELKAKHREVMQDVLMDVLRALTSPNMDIRKKTLDIALDLITSRNIDEVRFLSSKLIYPGRGYTFTAYATSPCTYKALLTHMLHLVADCTLAASPELLLLSRICLSRFSTVEVRWHWLTDTKLAVVRC